MGERDEVAAPVEDGLGLGPGLVRRARRAADISQRDLAQRLGVSQSTVARWETGQSSPALSVVEQMLAFGGLRLVMRDAAGEPVAPMREDAARDRAGRRFPAHADLDAWGWWVPQDLQLSVEWLDAHRHAAEQRIPHIRYAQSRWRGTTRRLLGTPEDHPTYEELVSAVETRTTPH